jgi:hypothetical protein
LKIFNREVWLTDQKKAKQRDSCCWMRQYSHSKCLNLMFSIYGLLGLTIFCYSVGAMWFASSNTRTVTPVTNAAHPDPAAGSTVGSPAIISGGTTQPANTKPSFQAQPVPAQNINRPGSLNSKKATSEILTWDELACLAKNDCHRGPDEKAIAGCLKVFGSLPTAREKAMTEPS